MSRSILPTIVFACLLTGPLRAEDPPMIPFLVGYDAPTNAVDLSARLEKPAGKSGFLRTEQGRFVNDRGPVRLWGVNLCFEACFPEHEQAERLARRLAWLGINAVRLHHMDNYSIWGDRPNHLEIDPKKLDKLDYLIYQLKENGVYVNINLHVSRWLDEKDGFPNREERPNYDKGVGNFEPRMIELQKKYARDLLTHRNPYTETTYCEEPAVAMIEISNEDALYAIWGWGELDNLGEPYRTTFQKQWNAWLREKYGATATLAETWNVGREELGEEMLENGDFTAPPGDAWQLERDDQTDADLAPVEGAGPEGSNALRLDVRRTGRQSWIPQLKQGGFSLEKNKTYTLTFFARADKTTRIGLNCMMAHEPWERLGLSADLEATPEWKRHQFCFVADRDDPDARITLNDFQPGRYEWADVSLRPGGVVGLTGDQRLEDDRVRPLQKRMLNVTPAVRADFADFLYDTEQNYWLGMYRYLKDELKVGSMVSGTQLGYGPASIQAELDYIDAHSYWNHPHFPNRPWDPEDWTVHNISLVNHPPGTLGSLAARRVIGKPYTVSEYNHPEPNYYAAEGFPMLASFGARQGWDGVFLFAYAHNNNFEPDHIGGFFDIVADTTRLVHMPACSLIFLRGDVPVAEEPATVRLLPEKEHRVLRETLNAWSLSADSLGLDTMKGLNRRIGMVLNEKNDPPLAETPEDSESSELPAGPIRWDTSTPGAGFYLLDTPRAKLFTGFVGDRCFVLEDAAMEIGATRADWATLSIVSLDDQPIPRSNRLLIAATGRTWNTDEQFQELPSDRITVGRQWGGGPVLCETVPAKLRLPLKQGGWKLYPLDENGNRREGIPIAAGEGPTEVELAPRYETLWYELSVE